MSDELLSAIDLTAGYNGDVPVLQGVSFSVRSNRVLAIIGPNGSGKSTLLKAILGIVPLLGGKIRLFGRNVESVSPQAMIRAGIGYVPQGHQVFSSLTVRENLEMGCYWMSRRDANRAVEEVLERVPHLKELADCTAGVLSGGEQQLVSIGRALVHNPRILLVDEPTAGLSPRNVELIFDILNKLCAHGTGMILVEQKARRALEFADEALILDLGRVCMYEPAQLLIEDPRVRSLYLGET